MPWSGGSYTKGNASTGGWTGDATLGIGIEAGRHDTQDNDFATGINNCLTKDGSNSATANINFGGFLPSNVGAGTAAAPAYCAGGDSNTGMFSKAADAIGWATNGVERINLTSTGQLTLRSADAAATVYQIEQWANTTNTGLIQFVKSRGGALDANAIVQNNDFLGTIRWMGANGTGFNGAAQISAEVDGAPGASNDMPGRLVFSTTADGAGSPTERMRITSAGNVGIGVVPTEKLDVNGVLYIRTSSAPSFDSGTRFWAEAGVGANYDSFNHKFNCGTGTRIEAMRLDSSGNVLIAKTSAVVTGSGSYFTQAGNTAHPALLINTKTASGNVLAIQNHHNGVYVGGVSYDNTSTSFPTSSDYRLKENVVAIDHAVDRLKSLKPVRFNFIATPEKTQDGFLAHEVAEVVPNAVSGEKDAEDENGNMIIQALDHSKLVPLLTAALKELVARVEALEAA